VPLLHKGILLTSQFPYNRPQFLLSNAVKFTSEGGRIGINAIPVDGSVEISVSDTAIGITPEDQATIFEEFR